MLETSVSKFVLVIGISKLVITWDLEFVDWDFAHWSQMNGSYP